MSSFVGYLGLFERPLLMIWACICWISLVFWQISGRERIESWGFWNWDAGLLGRLMSELDDVGNISKKREKWGQELIRRTRC